MQKNPLKVLFVASECTPIAKVGGLGDVIGSLPKALKELGLDVRIALPKYGIIDVEKYPSKLIASGVKVNEEKINVYQTYLPESKVILYLLENERYFAENNIYFERTAFVGPFKEIERFLFFSQAVLEIFPQIDWFPEIFHCHDWQAAILPILIKIKKLKVKTLLTIHNLANQAKWNPKEILSFLGLKGDEAGVLKTRDENGDFNIFQQGILTADILSTVSPTYSREILTADCGYGLENSLLRRKEDLFGILNSIDTDSFNPETDPYIKNNYSLKNFDKKVNNKLDLQETLNFLQNKKTPLLGVINRLTFQKGMDLILEIIPELVKLNCQLVVLGQGEGHLEKKLLDFGKKYPQNISIHIKFDLGLAQKIYAGCDIFLMPSLFEPCGLGQMIAMRYGTIPIVRKTGGLADTVKNKETGFVFEKYDSKSLLKTINLALRYYTNKKAWNKIIKRAMSQDFSWRKSAKEYLKLYQKLI